MRTVRQLFKIKRLHDLKEHLFIMLLLIDKIKKIVLIIILSIG